MAYNDLFHSLSLSQSCQMTNPRKSSKEQAHNWNLGPQFSSPVFSPQQLCSQLLIHSVLIFISFVPNTKGTLANMYKPYQKICTKNWIFSTNLHDSKNLTIQQILYETVCARCFKGGLVVIRIFKQSYGSRDREGK